MYRVSHKTTYSEVTNHNINLIEPSLHCVGSFQSSGAKLKFSVNNFKFVY